MTRNRSLFLWLGATLLATLATTPIRADEKADALLKEAEQTAYAAQTLTADLSLSQYFKNSEGKDATFKLAGTLKLKKPNLAHADFTEGLFVKIIDATGLNLYLLPVKYHYRKSIVDAKGNALDFMWATPVSMFFGEPSSGVFGMEQKPATAYLGKRMVDGVECDVVELKGKEPFVYVMKLSIAPNKLATHMDINYTQDDLKITLNAALKNVKINVPLPATPILNALPSGAVWDDPLSLLPLGSTAPRFALSTPTGGKIALEDALKGKKAFLVNFWYYHCGPCREELPHLQELYAELKDKGLGVVALNGMDGAEVINKYVKENRFTFLIGMKGKGDNYDAALQYRVQGYPTNYVLDSEGKIIFRADGFDEQAIRKALAKLGVK